MNKKMVIQSSLCRTTGDEKRYLYRLMKKRGISDKMIKKQLAMLDDIVRTNHKHSKDFAQVETFEESFKKLKMKGKKTFRNPTI